MGCDVARQYSKYFNGSKSHRDHIKILLDSQTKVNAGKRDPVQRNFVSKRLVQKRPKFAIKAFRGQSIKKPNFFNLSLNLQLNQTYPLQSTSLHCRYTAPKFLSSSGKRPATYFAEWHEDPVLNSFEFLYRLKSATF
jgi:hypothetical protein